jgi:hypothetical protein
MSKLLDYINHLDKNSDARATHAADPKAAMAQFGLTDAEQQAALSGDKVAISKLAGVDLKDGDPPQVACLHDAN